MVCWKKVKDGPFLLSVYQGRFYVRLKFTGKPLLVKNRNGFYQERFYMRSKFRCKSVVHRDIHGELLPSGFSGYGVKSSHTDNTSLLASFYMSKHFN